MSVHSSFRRKPESSNARPRVIESAVLPDRTVVFSLAAARSWIPACAGMTVLLLSLAAIAADDQPDPALCNALVKHTPAPDVAYQPGVDVDGNPVAPADLPGQPQLKLPDKLNFPLTISLAKALNLNTSVPPWNQLGQGTEATLGNITVEGDKVSFNGEPLTDEQQDNLAVLCMGPDD